MKKFVVTALLASAAIAHAQNTAAPASSSPAKKELIQKLMVLQQPGIENVARGLVEQPAAAMIQAAGRALQQVPADKREATGKSIEADVKKYVEETNPMVRERAIKLAPSTIGAALEDKLTEDELKQLIAWLESPVRKKYEQIVPEVQKNFTEKLVAESRPSVEPKLQALEAKVRASLGVPPAAAASGASAPKAATPAKKPASK
ncbi:hypothetical protein [Rhizobacter sp. Root404]|uniref:hypothetical protein n=1 Tax=Rhizobacter sp. Root404 TaxID=1736528 RepID=UPI0006FFDA6F|nr:hypothetical protein [Rhizobacter sp. Root404]KQW36068.1 hypothetical protein ASC76_15160 [Rhizobacter sp. Root404]